jgi:4'-phosphopantetheinyl transferase
VNAHTPSNSDIHIWQIDLTLPADDSSLSPEERTRAERVIIQEKRRQFVAARYGLRAILSRYVGIPPQDLIFAYHTHGKPFLVGNATIEFNLAHSGDLALVAVARQPVGVDLEQIHPLPSMAQMAQIAFTPEELRALYDLPPQRRLCAFYRIWTRKEALMKAQGDGFRRARNFNVPVTHPQQTIELDGWAVYDIPHLPGFIAAVATRQAGVNIQLYECFGSHDTSIIHAVNSEACP